jgi:hypothetical protein
VWLQCLKVSGTEARSFLCSEPLNPGWKWPCFTPGPEAIFDPFCWVPKNKAASPRRHHAVVRVQGVRLVPSLLDLEQYRLRYVSCKLESLAPNPQPLPLARDASLHTDAPSPPPGLKIDTGSPITLIYEGGCSTAAGADAEGPRHSGPLDSVSAAKRPFTFQAGTAAWPCTRQAADTSNRAEQERYAHGVCY